MQLELSGFRVLVLGGGGFIGRRVVARLLAEGATVRVLDLNSQQSVGVAEDERIQWITASILDEAAVATAARKCEAAVCLATSSLPASANKDMSTEIAQHLRPSVMAAEICEAEGVRNFIFASSGGTVYGLDSFDPLKENSPTLPRNAYGASKLAIEHYLRILGNLRGLRTLSLRISNPFGPGQLAARGQGFVAAAMHCAYTGEPLTIWGDGSTIRDFLYVDDLAEAIARSISYQGDCGVMNIGSGIGCSLLHIITNVESATGRKINVIFDSNRPIDVACNVLDIAESQRELRWQPGTSIGNGISLTAAWWKKALGKDL